MASIRKFFVLIIGIFIILLIGIISASYSNKCLSYGESVPSMSEPRYTCESDMCQICVNSNNYPTHPGYCNKMEPCKSKSLACVDNNPPTLNIISPKQNKIYNSRKVIFNLSSDKPVTFYYIDNINGRGRWSKLGYRTTSYNKEISFKDGYNNITIKAIDNCGDSSTQIIEFYVDSKKPKFGKIETENLKAFNIELIDENPKSLTLYLGNNATGYSNINLDINKCTFKSKGKGICEFNITNYNQLLSKYNNQDILYYLLLKDIANNNVTSKISMFHVDLTNPVIKNPESVFSIDGKKIEFYVEVIEENFDKIIYIDNSQSIVKEKTLCTKLTTGYCLKKVSFSQGDHNIIIKVFDKSGNTAIQNINFSI